MGAYEFGLEEKVVVVASQGPWWLGNLAESFQEAGAKKVVLAGPDLTMLATAVPASREGGEGAVVVTGDLTNEKDVERMVGQVISQFGRIDTLVNALNVEFWKPTVEMREDEWKQTLDTNLTSTFLCVREVGKHMKTQGKGSIVNVTSGLAQRGTINGAANCASMGGVLQMTRSLALEWASEQVRVNAIGVGWMEDSGTKDGKDVVAGYIPMRRRAVAGDVVPLIVFLASEASSYLSGNIYMVDGGLMARG